MPTVALSDIRVGRRHRRDLGDVERLARSISDVGLLHAVVVDDDNRLIAGERRIAAAKQLGWTTVPVRRVPLEKIVRGEFAENAERKDFTPSEIDAIRRAMLPLEQAAARERKGEARKTGKVSPSNQSRSRDKVGAFAGVSGRQVEKIAEVVDAAVAEPERFADLKEEMDRTGKVNGAHRKMRQRQDEEKRLAVQPVAGRHRSIIIDPPWDHEGLSIAGRGAPTYAVMTQEELIALPVGEWADSECHLYVWATNNFLLRAGALIEAWGFDYKTVLTWVKPRFGLGSYFRSSTEHCLFAVKGSMMTRASDIPTHFEAPVGRHSEKPDAFYDLVERASYPSYLEAFARRPRQDWQGWGAGVTP